MSALVARARGLATRKLDRAESASALETMLRVRGETDLVLLDRWADEPLDVLTLDEDRRSLRAIVRGLAGTVPAISRTAGALATPTLPRSMLDALARATSLPELARVLGDHPLAPAITAVMDVFAIEHALARHYYAAVGRRKGALGIYVSQLVDVDNAIAALLLAARGSGDTASMFLPGGRRVDRATFLAACTAVPVARERLARAFVKTPLEAALYAPQPAALEDAALAWHLATQTHERRLDPLGFAAVIHLVLERRREARMLRRAAWRLVLGA